MRPDSEAQLAEMIKSCRRPVAVMGGGTRRADRAQGDLLETAALSGVKLYEPGALTLVVGAGTLLQEVEALLAGQNQRLAFEPPDLRALLARTGHSTIGGVVAENASGPRRVSLGACRDFCLGVRFVDGQGNIIKNGGRVMKNVTGYDLVKLLAGSRGSLGVITEIALKTLPLPEEEGTLFMAGLSDEQGIAAMSSALSSPFEVRGAAHISGQGTYVRVEGFAASVAYRLKRLRERLAGFGAEPEPRSPWAHIRDVGPFVGQEGDVWRLMVRPSHAARLVAQAQPLGAIYDWGGGLVWLLVPQGVNLYQRLGFDRAIMPFGGHLSCLRGAFAGQIMTQEAAFLSAGIRQKFDPNGIFV